MGHTVANKQWRAGSEMNSGHGGHRNTGMGNGYKANYYTNKCCNKNNGNIVTTGNPANTTSGRKDITGPWPNYGKKEETVFVDINATLYYEYTVTNLNCQIQIKILDQNLKCW